MNLVGKKIAIPGGTGFFGSHIIDKLKDIKCEVFVPERSKGIDFRNREDCRKFFEQTKPEIVINCAAFQGGIGFHLGKQADLFMDNILMGCFLMEAAQKVGVKKFVNIVAGCAYPGYLEKDILDETDFWDGDLHDSIFSYGFSRKATIVYGKALYRQYGFNSIHLVFANMYGPRDHFNPSRSKALDGLIRKIYEAKRDKLLTVEIWGSGKPLRDWLYVKDGADGVLRAVEIYDRIDPLNIATGKGISVRELAETVKRVVGYSGKFVYNTQKPDGALKKVFGVRKMKTILKWEPKTNIEQGIRETVKWYVKNSGKGKQENYGL